MKNLKTFLTGSATAVALFCACNPAQSSASVELTKSGLNPADFDTCIAVSYDKMTRRFMPDTTAAKQVKLYTLTNGNGMEVCVTNFGGRIVSAMVPNRDGELVDVVCGFDKIENYFPWNYETDYGCSVGRYANRIGGGTYTYEGETVTLPRNNNGAACLHGGYTGWQYQVYDVVEVSDQAITLKRVSPAGDNDFPGNVEATVKFELTDDNAIEITYGATTDAPTVINMTNHSYFNLSGDLTSTVDEAELYVNADNYTPADRRLIPTGEIKPVAGTVFDFTTPRAIGSDFAKNDPEMMSVGGGYDHNWCLNTKGDQSEICATLVDPRSGIQMDMYTNEPGVQCYTANFQNGTCPGKNGIKYQKHCAICLESQKYPDSPNKVGTPGWEDSNAFVTPDKPYYSYCKYAFSIAE